MNILSKTQKANKEFRHPENNIYSLPRINISTKDELFYILNLQKQFEDNEEKGADSFPIIMDVNGPIIKYSDSWSEQVGTQFYLQVFKQLENTPKVSGIILNIDSGGGMVSGTAEFAETIKNSKKPTASFTNGYMCSAAYNIGAAADRVVSSPYADLIGSIGTYLSYQDFSAMFEKWGAKIHEVYAPQSTEKNKWYRDLKEGDEKALEDDLRIHADEFISTIKTYRGDRLKDDDKVFKGKVYAPQSALKIGLVDNVETIEWLINQF